MSSELAKIEQSGGSLQIRSVADMQNIAKLLAQSGYFSDARDMAQCFTKVLAGNSMGIDPFSSMTGIHVIKGKPSVGSGLMAAKVKASQKYNYKVLVHSSEVCRIQFYELWDGQWQESGVSEFTLEDAKRAGTQNIQKFPRNMLFARAMSNGVKFYCPDVFSAPVYTPEELGAQTDGEGNVIDVVPEPESAAPSPITERFNFIAGKTGHNRETAIAAAQAIDVPASSKQMDEGQFILFRNRLLAEWGLQQGAFNHINHAMASLRHVPGHDGPDDAAVWDAWEVKVGMKLAGHEAERVNAEVVDAVGGEMNAPADISQI